MKITGARSYINIEYNGKVAQFYGELCIDGFAAIADTMKWLPPYEKDPVTEKERLALMQAVREELKDNKYKVFFTNEAYEDIEF